MHGLLNLLGATRGDVRPWPEERQPPVPASRAATLWRALLPAEALPGWTGDGPLDLDGVQRLEPADEQEEASAIALVLRQGLERPGARVALVTPDRQLATRVAATSSTGPRDGATDVLSMNSPHLLTRALDHEPII